MRFPMKIFGVQRRQKQKDMRLNGLKAIRRVTIHLIFALLAWAAPALGHAMQLPLITYPFLQGWVFLECGLLYCYRLAPRNPHLCQAIIWSFSIPFTSILFLLFAACMEGESVAHPSARLVTLADKVIAFVTDPTGEGRLLLGSFIFLGGLRIVSWILEVLFGIAGNPVEWPEVITNFLRRNGLKEPQQGPALWLYRKILLLIAKGYVGCSGAMAAYSTIWLLYPPFGHKMGYCLAMQFEVSVLAVMVAGVGCLVLHIHYLMGSERTVYFPELINFFAFIRLKLRERTTRPLTGRRRWCLVLIKPAVKWIVRFSIRHRPDREDVWQRLTMPPTESTSPVRAGPEATVNRFERS